MMIKNHFIEMSCDKCNCKIQARYFYSIDITEKDSETMDNADTTIRKDFCSDCYNKLTAFFKS